MTRLVLAASVVLGLAISEARARQEQPEPAEVAAKETQVKGPKGPDILRAADQKIAKAKTLSFKASMRGIGALATRSPEATGSVVMVKDAKAPTGYRFTARGPSRGGGKESVTRDFATSYDGKIVRSIREKERKVMEAAWSSSTDLMDDGAGWTMSWILQWKLLITDRFNEPENMVPSRVEGVADVGGVTCNVVYVDYSELSDRQLFDVWWFIGKDDSLPRRVDMHLIGVGGDGFTTTTIEKLELDVPVDEGALALAVPDGFDVEKAKEPLAREGIAIVKPGGPQSGNAAPEWTHKDADGKEHTLSDYRGKIVVMDFWATWCGPCRAAMPGIQKIHETYKDKGVVVLGMNCWESGDAAAYMKENKFTYGLILKADEAARAYGVSGIPTIYVIGPDGKVVYQSVGYAGDEPIVKAIESKLKP